MSLSVAVDAVVLISAVLGTWWGWGRGASRMIISTLATVAGLFLAARGVLRFWRLSQRFFRMLMHDS